jgi:hypothetical protein
MYYIAPPDNKLVRELPEFRDHAHVEIQDLYSTDKEGYYRVAALPGRAVIGVNAIEQYPGGQGFETIVDRENSDGYMQHNGAITPNKKFPTAVKEIFIEGQGSKTSCDFAIDPGYALKLKIVDAKEEPLNDVSVRGTGPTGGGEKATGSEVMLPAFSDDEQRTVLLHHVEKRLGKALRITGEQARKGPLTVRLEPCATVIGQLVDAARLRPRA